MNPLANAGFADGANLVDCDFRSSLAGLDGNPGPTGSRSVSLSRVALIFPFWLGNAARRLIVPRNCFEAIGESIIPFFPIFARTSHLLGGLRPRKFSDGRPVRTKKNSLVSLFHDDDVPDVIPVKGRRGQAHPARVADAGDFDLFRFHVTTVVTSTSWIKGKTICSLGDVACDARPTTTRTAG